MESQTQALHRLTSYEPAREWTEPIDDPRIVQDLEVNDLDRLPWFYKRYDADLPRMELPRDLPATTADAVEVISGTADIAPGRLDLAQLGRVLYLSAGVVRTAERPFGTYPFRAAGSAGARFPLELYVAVPGGHDLPPGVHWYHPEDHALLQVGPPPRGTAPALVVTGIPWRTGWRYRERGYRHVYWDAGTMLSQSLAAAHSGGLPARLFTRFPDEPVSALVGAEGVHEWPVALVALDDGQPALGPTGVTTPGRVDADPLEFPLVTAAQHAGDMGELGEPWAPGPPSTPALGSDVPVERVVLARGSMRRMDPSQGLSRELLHTAMGAAMRGIDVPHFVVVHDVESLRPGVYRWPDLVTPVRADDLRKELYRVALDQGLARDAAFVVISAVDVSSLDDRGYREAQLAAGLVEGRLHLLAYALDAGASGMTFLDSEMPDLLGEELEGLLFTCVGVPEYRSRRGGEPGAPVRVRSVMPRLDDE